MRGAAVTVQQFSGLCIICVCAVALVLAHLIDEAP
jgi:hypothetical protein